MDYYLPPYYRAKFLNLQGTGNINKEKDDQPNKILTRDMNREGRKIDTKVQYTSEKSSTSLMIKET